MTIYYNAACYYALRLRILEKNKETPSIPSLSQSETDSIVTAIDIEVIIRKLNILGDLFKINFVSAMQFLEEYRNKIIVPLPLLINNENVKKAFEAIHKEEVLKQTDIPCFTPKTTN